MKQGLDINRQTPEAGELNALDERSRELAVLAAENLELKERLEAQRNELYSALDAQEEMFKTSYTWRVGWCFTEGFVLLRALLKNPVKFSREGGDRFRDYLRVVFPAKAGGDAAGDSVQAENESLKSGLVDKKSSPPPVVRTPAGESRVRIGCILDEFSGACFGPECDLVPLRPDTWRQTLEADPPRAILVESAWRGHQNSWRYRIDRSLTTRHDELLHLLTWAGERKIPTLFWNKEDPVHLDRFMERARLFDYVFTTDANCVPEYRKRLGHDCVFPLPFAAQPLIDNPILDEPRTGSVCFAGTYDGNRYEERRSDMEHLLKPSIDFGLEIYDRNFGVTGKQAEMLAFPDIYQGCIKGRLGYADMVKAYKKYRVFLNVNSVKDSPTMFARRVFELLASGTPVISNYSRGIVELLGEDTVFISESEADTRKHPRPF